MKKTASKSLSVLLLLLTVFSTGVYAQSEPSKPNYENRVYEKDNDTYVQKSLPVYLKFSVTPEGKDYPLKSQQNTLDANPIYLDTEGINWIRSRWAVDPNTRKPVVPQREVMMELYADGLAPISRLNYSNAPRYVANGVTYYGKDLSLSITSKDAVSGVMETQYALNGGYSKYGSDVNVTKEGPTTLYYYSVDYVGNTEQTKSTSFTLDLTGPTSAHEIVGIVHDNTIISPSTTFKLTSSDNLSGVKSVLFSFDNGSDRSYKPNIGVSHLSDGDHTLYYYSIDNVRNGETEKSFKFYYDKIPPVVTAKIVGDQYKSNYTYVSERTKINLQATDNKAGVYKIYHRIDSAKEKTDYSSDFNVPNTLGVHSIMYDATDNVENLAENKYMTVFMDNKKPNTSIDYGKPQFFSRDILFITSNTNVTLKGKDGHSGIKKVEYTIDDAGLKSYEPFTISGEGNHTISFKSTDNVNNEEELKTSKVFVDNTPPEIYVNFSIKPIGEKDGNNVYPNYVRMFVGATDDHVGTEKVFYSIDGAPLREYSSPRTLDISELSKFETQKEYKVKVVCEDKLGNRSEKIFEFLVSH